MAKERAEANIIALSVVFFTVVYFCAQILHESSLALRPEVGRKEGS